MLSHKMNKRDKEAIAEMVQSEGWAVFSRLVQSFFNPATTVDRIIRLAPTATSVEMIGLQAATLVTAHDTAERILQLPYEVIQDKVDGEEEESA